MDLSGIENLIPPVAQLLGIEPATALLMAGLLVTTANVLGRVIPDTATGPLGVVRKVAKIIGLFVPNRIAPAVSVNDVAKAVVAEKVTQLKREIPADAKAILREQSLPPQE
jgi:hypothetical protein